MKRSQLLIVLNLLLLPILWAFVPSNPRWVNVSRPDPRWAGLPPSLTWDQLRDVQFRKKWYPEEGVVMLYPKFGPTVKALSGKAIAISGYVIPIDLESGVYVVSRFPVASCFFCGGAGPESIMMLKFKKLPRRFKTDERHTFTGTLRLNADNIYELNYILDGAELLPDSP